MKSACFALPWLCVASGVCIIPQSHANVTFNLVPESGTIAAAVAGFTTAANRWSAVLTDNITINLQIGYTTLSPDVLGQTTSSFTQFPYRTTAAALGTDRTSPEDFSSYGALPVSGNYSRLINRTSSSPFGVNSPKPYIIAANRVGMTTANAKALGLLAPSSSIDAIIRLNSSFAFDFNPDNGITATSYDFVGIAMHEIGHALGFVSAVDVLDQAAGGVSDIIASYTLDLFRFSNLSLAHGAGVMDLTADNREKYFSVNGGATQGPLFSNGRLLGDGNQASNWKDNLGIGALDPTASQGELLTLTANDLLAMDVIGYNLVPEPSTFTLLLAGMVILARRQARI